MENKLSRRDFLSSAAVIGAAGAVGTSGVLLNSCTADTGPKYTPLRPASEVYIPDLPSKAVDGKPLRAALIGCGSRGSGAATQFLRAADGVSIVACADLFEDRMTTFRNLMKTRNMEIPDDKCFLGFDSYQKVLQLPEVDVALIASPSIFHATQLKYAIEMGKHTFCEKPAAIDAAGYRTFMAAIRQAASSGLNVMTGTQRHHQRGYVESYRKVQQGYIGQIVSGNVYWNQGIFSFKLQEPQWTDMEYMIRDFFSWNWLCGDHIIDQCVHNIDVFTWFSHLKPKFVIGMGSRAQRWFGNIYDNFSADIEYEGGVHLHAMARQIDNCHNRTAEIIQGSKGSWSSLDNQFIIRDLDGNIVWQFDREAERDLFEQLDPYTLEHVNFINHIRQEKVLNIAEITAISSMAGVMARESAYTGKGITWEEMTNSDLDLMPKELKLANVDMTEYRKIPLPGTSPLPPRPPQPRPQNAPQGNRPPAAT